MKLVRFLGPAAAAAALIGAGLFARPAPTPAADSPATLAHPEARIADVYLFPSPSNPSNVVAVMNVSPGLGAGTAAATFFDQKVLYTMKFDNKVAGEAVGASPVEDLVMQFSFGAAAGGTQQVIAYGPAAPKQTGTRTMLVNGGQAAGLGLVDRGFTTSTGVNVFAGERANPNFADVAQFGRIFPTSVQPAGGTTCLPGGTNACPSGFAVPGVNGFANTNVLSIVIELPKATLIPAGTGPKIAYWATTSSASGQ